MNALPAEAETLVSRIESMLARAERLFTACDPCAGVRGELHLRETIARYAAEASYAPHALVPAGVVASDTLPQALA